MKFNGFNKKHHIDDYGQENLDQSGTDVLNMVLINENIR
jgi:hypothetical protein